MYVHSSELDDALQVRGGQACAATTSCLRSSDSSQSLQKNTPSAPSL